MIPCVLASITRGILSSKVSPAIVSLFLSSNFQNFSFGRALPASRRPPFTSLSRLLSGRGSVRPRIKHHFRAAVFLVAEHFVHLRRLRDRHAMADDEARVDLAALHPIEQWLHIFHHVR